MPKRTRSHHLEDASIRRFEQCLPERWVCRRKDRDYGVDLEVEIFDKTDEATGLMFYVQIKGTDDPDKIGSVSIKADRLEYLSNLDSPSIIVRYFSGTDSFRWMWLTNVQAQFGAITTATTTIQFDESTVWSKNDPQHMERTLEVYRTIRLSPRRLPIGLTISPSHPTGPSDFDFRCAVANVSEGSRSITASADPTKCLPVAVSLDDDLLHMEIDVIASIGVRLRSFDQSEIAAQLAYMLAFMAGRYDFVSQAHDLARFIRERAYRCQSREIAAVVASMIADHTDLAADLAALNELHACQDPAYAIYTNGMLSSTRPLEDRFEAISQFYEAALAAQAADGGVQSTIHYSYGNALRISRDFLGAVRQYNLARKKNPEYCERSYFISELAASCFFARRFAIASTLYAKAYTLDVTPQTAICAGDAYLFGGQSAEAASYFEKAEKSSDEFESAEGTLKHWLALWVMDFGTRHETMAHPGTVADTSFWRKILREALVAGNVPDALGSCLLLCYLDQEDTVPLWAQAVGITPFVASPRLITAVVSCAIWVHGYAAYALFREDAVANGIAAADFGHMDHLAAELHERRRIVGREGVTARLVGLHHWDTIVMSDGRET